MNPGPLPGGAFDLGRSMAAAQAALAAENLDEAEELCRIVLEHDSVGLPARFFLAIIASKRGDRKSAIELLQGILAIKPNGFEAIEYLANLYREEGEFELAIAQCETMIRLRPNHPGGPAMLGMCYLDVGRPVDALPLFQRATALAPSAPPFHFHLGRVFEMLVSPAEAEAAYRRAIELAPQISMFHEALGKLLFLSGRREEGVVSMREAARLEPSSGRLLLLASGLTEVGKHAEAVEAFEQVIRLDPSNAPAHELMGYALQVLGRFEEADHALHRAIELDPFRARAYLAITSAQRITEDQLPFVARIERMAADRGMTKEDLRQLHYALGKAYADLGRYEEAMSSYDRANELAFATQRKYVAFDLKGQREWIDHLTKTFTRGFFRKNRDIGSSSQLPVLIVGMIRSGTTLADQVLSSHPQIGSADEMVFWTDPLRLQMIQRLKDGPLPRAETQATVEEYLAKLDEAGPGKSRVIDKMPRNYLVVGLIHLLFPEARIIHCRRDPVDTALSIYTTPFGAGAEFCYNRQSIVDAYREYQRVMAHWRAVIPADRLLEVRYEDMVGDPERIAREMVAFCGLEWDDACLHPEQNRRSVNTPSLWQVRQPIYRTSVKRSRPFEPWLGEFASLRTEAS